MKEVDGMEEVAAFMAAHDRAMMLSLTERAPSSPQRAAEKR